MRTSAIFAQTDRLVESRRRHVLLAEGARRRGRARHADPEAARGRASGELHAAVAVAEALPHDQEAASSTAHLRRRDDQHAVHAVRRGLPRCADLGRERRRARRADGARRRQCEGAARLDRAHAMGRQPRRRPGDVVEHVGVPQDRRSGRACAARRCAGCLRQEHRRPPRQGGRGEGHRVLSRRAAGSAGSGPARRWRRAISRRWCRGSTGPSPRPRRGSRKPRRAPESTEEGAWLQRS